MIPTDWSNVFKIKLATKVDESMDFHDIVKLLVVRKILRKYRKRHFIRIYTEWKINGSGLIPDIYMENIKDKTIICYEIQKECPQEYIDTKTKKYNNLKVPFFKSVDLIIIPLKPLSNNIDKLNKQLDNFIM